MKSDLRTIFHIQFSKLSSLSFDYSKLRDKRIKLYRQAKGNWSLYFLKFRLDKTLLPF